MYDKKFEIEKKKNYKKKNYSSKKFLNISKNFNIQASLNKYTYNFNWLGSSYYTISTRYNFDAKIII